MKKNYEVSVRIPEDLLRKLLALCEAENRTPNAQFNLMLRNAVQYAERSKKGNTFDDKKLRSYDLTPYEVKEEE